MAGALDTAAHCSLVCSVEDLGIRVAGLPGRPLRPAKMSQPADYFRSRSKALFSFGGKRLHKSCKSAMLESELSAWLFEIGGADLSGMQRPQWTSSGRRGWQHPSPLREQVVRPARGCAAMVPHTGPGLRSRGGTMKSKTLGLLESADRFVRVSASTHRHGLAAR